MKKISVLTGAGISKESGINTFRDTNGLWEEYDVADVASIEGWYRNRGLVLDFYNARRRQLQTVEPNIAHKILFELEENYDIHIITQNVDNLHERAGSTKVLHLHGELTKVHPENQPKNVTDIGYKDINLGDLSNTGVQLRPHIVWFGEAVPLMEEAASIISSSDLLLVVGTSLNVYPAAGLVNYIKEGAELILIDPEPININYKHYTQIQDIASKGMEKFKMLYI